jgi:hypothetical protein
MKITSTDELPREATKREQHKPHEPPFGAPKRNLEGLTADHIRIVLLPQSPSACL